MRSRGSALKHERYSPWASLKVWFITSSNQAEYETIIADLNLVHDMEDKHLICRSDSQLVVGQLKEEFEVEDSLLQRYYHLVRSLMTKFKNVRIEYIHRDHNTRVVMLSRIATIKKKSFISRSSTSTSKILVLARTNAWQLGYKKIGWHLSNSF